jgi:sugar lactone lactonase YvrE
VLRVRGKDVTLFATLPASVAAFHLAFGPDGSLYVTAPTLASRDAVYRIAGSGAVAVFYEGFGRPQGLAFDSDGRLYVVDALAGSSGLYRFTLDRSGSPEQVLVGGSLIGLAFDPHGGLVLASNDTAYRLNVPLRGLLSPGGGNA